MKLSHVLGMTFSVSLLATPAFAQAEPQLPEQEERWLDGVPQAARSTIQRHVGDGQIRSVERKQRDDRTVYEVEYRGKDGIAYELKVDSQGKLIEKEREGD